MPRLVYKNAVLALLVVLYAFGATLPQAGAQTTRQVTIKCLDQHDQPLADVSVSVVLQTGDRDSLGDTPHDLPANLPANSPNDSSADLSADKPTANAPAAVFTTDAQGEVTFDTHQLKLANPDAAVTVYGWKPGYRFCIVSVQKQATLRMYPQEMRTFQILDHQGQPVAGAEVELSAAPALRAIPLWTSQSRSVTDSMGVVRLPVSVEALAASLTVRTRAGVSFTASLLSVSYLRMLDPRDLTIVRLTETGRLQGTVPAQLAKQYRLQLQPVTDLSRQRLGRNEALARPDIQIDADGRFDVHHVSAGKYWLTIERRLPFTPDLPEAAGQPESSQLLDGPREILIQAGQTTSLELKQAGGARVTGTLVSTDSDVDYSNLRVSFNRIISTGDASNRMMQGRTATAVCNALGQYQAELLPGDYGVSLDTSNDFQQRQSQNFIVGPGAATVTVDDVSIIKTSPIQVRLVDAFSQDFLSTPNGLLGVGIAAKNGEQRFCALTADGYGRVYLSAPLNEMEITLRNLKHPTLTCRLIDRDPEKDMELVIDRQTQGQESNVQLRGRVVDSAGVGLAGVPLQLTLTYHAISTGQTSVMPMSMSRAIFGQMVTQADGSISLPPMQVFKATTLSRSIAPQMGNSSFKIKFIFLLKADSAVGEVSSRHEIEVDPARWQSPPEIVFPDIVLPKRPEFQTVVGRLTDQQSQPLAGKIVWLSQDLSMIRALTDPDGQFKVEKVADPAWLLCQQDWSVRRLGDLSKPIELKSLSDQKTDSATEIAAVPAPASKSESISLKARLSLEERRKLAKEQIDQLPNQQRFGLLRTLPLDAYLDPDKYFQTLRQRRNDISDSVRLSFIDFWHNLSDEQLEQLAEAMSDDNSRAAVFWILANRHPSQAAFEKVAELLAVPKSAVPRMLLDENSVDLFGKVLVKLHRYSAVEPYYEKMQAYIHAWQTQRPQMPPRMNAVRSYLQEPIGIQVCRALLDLDGFKNRVLEESQQPENDIELMERSAWSAQNILLLRLFPQYFSSVPLPRYSVNDVFWMELGELIPQPAWKAIKNQQNDSSTIRWLVAGALTAKHPDAQELFQQAVGHELHSMDSQYSRLSSVSSRSSLVIPWVLAAKRHSPQLGKQACWLLAHDYLSGRLEPSSTSVLPTTQRLDNQALAVALCIESEFPELAQMIVDRCVPKVLEQLEQDMAQPYARSLDASLVAYFAPQQTTELIKRMEQQNVNAAPANGLPSARLISLAQMRQSCLRGLLLDAEQLLGANDRR